MGITGRRIGVKALQDVELGTIVIPYATSGALASSRDALLVDLQDMPSERRHSWHSRAHPRPLSPPGSVTLSDDEGPGVAAGWTPPPPSGVRVTRMSLSRAGRSDVGRSDSWPTSGRRISPTHGTQSYLSQSTWHVQGIALIICCFFLPEAGRVPVGGRSVLNASIDSFSVTTF